MKISTKGLYALRVMVDLAINDTGEFIPLKNVSARQDITIKYLEQIIPLLSKAGYLKSSRGKDGGYRLSRPAKSYTVGDILRTVEGNMAPVKCLEDNPNRCLMRADCSALSVWVGLDRVINEYLDSIRLDELAENKKSMEGLDYSI
ncbi:MAG: Rrf2 family transcriptional regulator [Synergistaceae bacterium]|jgi:Rrf2 family protein|nr:Rrf2 family transcriptional regulator [Synergistaceae bacterium]